MKNKKDQFDFRPRPKPNFLMEAFAWCLLYVVPFILFVYLPARGLVWLMKRFL